MKFEEKDINLSYSYKKALEDSKEIGRKQIEKYKRKHSAKIEINLLLQNKDFIHNMTIDTGKKSKYEFLFEYFRSNFDISKKEIHKILRKNRIYPLPLKGIPISLSIITIDGFVVHNLEPGALQFTFGFLFLVMCFSFIFYLIIMFSSE